MNRDIPLLLRRAGFGPTAAELEAATAAGYRGVLSGVLQPSTSDVGAKAAPIPELGPDYFADKPKPTAEQGAAGGRLRKAQLEQITRWWLDRMTVADHQAVEKLSFFWHGHWATSIEKVKSPQLMLAQHKTIRNAPDFAVMVRQMVVDRALVYWLDGHHNSKGAPNENLARELMELFTLGVGNYTERDVKEAGRALTGWRVVLGFERSIFELPRHDSGNKTILGVTKNFDAGSLVDLLLAQKACPRFIASRLWFRYGSSTEPIPEALREEMAARFPAPMRMLQALFEDDAFTASRGGMVKQPVEWLVGAMRQLGLRPANFRAPVMAQILEGLKRYGQLPFAPPSVGGWPAGTAWLTPGTTQIRLGLASELAELATVDRLTPERLAHILCVDKWSNRTYAVLRNIRDPRHLLTLGLVSPEYLVT